MLRLLQAGQSTGRPVPDGTSQAWLQSEHQNFRTVVIMTLPPSSLSALPLASASATFRRADSTILEKVGRETFILSAASSW
jgi:hypothetical protein